MGAAPARSRRRRTDAVDGDGRFAVLVADSPAGAGEPAAAKLDAGYGARMAAGYCWPWSDPRPDGTLVDDVASATGRRPWNLKGDRAVGGAPPARALGDRPGGLRPGRLRLHRSGLRVRLVRRDHRAGPGLARRSLGQPVGRPTRTRTSAAGRVTTRSSTGSSATSTRCC